MSLPPSPALAVARIIERQPSALVRAYTRVRFHILRQRFLEEIGQYLPAQGEVLDLGAGFGLFSLYFALTGPGRRLTGVELNERRVHMARTCAEQLGLQNVSFHAQNALDFRGTRTFDAIYMLDLLHHLPAAEVPGFLRGVTELLAPNGILLIKDVSDRPVLKRWFTLWLDRLMVGLREPIRYWPPEELSAVLSQLGFTVRRHAMNDYLPYPHMLYVCTRTAPAGSPSQG